MNRPGGPGTWSGNGHEPAPQSSPQGYAPSDPDWNGNGGLDKPGQTGGFSDDRDGNNGCGNDDDREDDNNGRCGVSPAAQPPSPPPTVIPPPVRVFPTKITPRTLPRTGIDPLTFLWLGTGMTLSGHTLRRRGRRAR